LEAVTEDSVDLAWANRDNLSAHECMLAAAECIGMAGQLITPWNRRAQICLAMANWYIARSIFVVGKHAGEMPDGWVPKEQAVNVRPIGTYPPKFCGKDEPHAPHDYNVVSASSISGPWWRCQGRYDPPINFCGSTVHHAAHNSHQMNDDGMPMWRCLGFQPIGRPQA
jgi:hypothetical protein